MPTIPKLTYPDIQKWAGEKSFERGQTIFRNNSIQDQTCSDLTLKSKCLGTQAPFYRQEVTFNQTGIQSAECTCLVGKSGHCKHVVALLLTWVKNKKSFHEAKSLNMVLEARSKDELIAIIQRLVNMHPDLEDLVNLPMADQKKSTPIDLKVIRQRAHRIIQQIDYGEYGAFRAVANEFAPLLILANDYRTQGDTVNAASIYNIICEHLLDQEYLLNSDEEGELGSIISNCATYLGQCLATINGPKKREEILQTLLSIYERDMLGMGGTGLSDEVPAILIEQASVAEKEKVATWIQKILLEEQPEQFGRRCLGTILLELKKATLTKEDYLTICRETGLNDELVERLLEDKQIDEAVEVARNVSDYELLQLSDIFSRYQHDSLIEAVIRERAKTTKDTRLHQLLQSKAEARGEFEVAYSIAEKIFWQSTNVVTFQEVAKCGQKISNWDEKRKAILSKLETAQNFILLIKIYLSEGDVKSALLVWEKSKPQQTRFNIGNLQSELAKAAENSFPREAIDLYLQLAGVAINHRNRQEYAEASAFLSKVKALYQKLGEIATWDTCIANLRTQYRTLPALLDELRKAKL
ncbi:MAG: hypothetical protein BWK79_09265 [Beggiatoa sp. IS2]|nr:MAG: hypothetical protein BWK79_09265 [Beggiatoa sp. IS2]